MQWLENGLNEAICGSVDKAWTLANKKNDELCYAAWGISGREKAPSALKKRYMKPNDEAREAFHKRKTDGLNLSDRVWRYTAQFKEEMELGIDLGIRSGRSADQLSRDLRAYLKAPDKLFRRVRNEHGQLVLSQRAKAYHPGRGVYRSSYKNAQRLAATETNMAYRAADYERWQQMDFVIGIEIRTSNNHLVSDICDDLKGKYPKDFKWTGWHPFCRCHAVPILKTQEEMMKDNGRIMRGEEPLPSKQKVEFDGLNEFRRWASDSAERIESAKSLPYFIEDNRKYIDITSKSTGANGYTGAKLGREATKDARREYETTKATVLTEQQKQNIDDIALALNTKAVPMTFNEADNGQANIKYDIHTSYSDNCQTCVVVHEARLRGLDITSLGYISDKNGVQYKLGNDSSLAWINPNNGKVPQINICKNGSDEDKYAWLYKQTRATGRYHIGVNNKNGTGHIFTSERINGKLLLYDPQKNEFLKLEELDNLESIELLRVDKLLINKDVLLSISRLV